MRGDPWTSRLLLVSLIGLAATGPPLAARQTGPMEQAAKQSMNGPADPAMVNRQGVALKTVLDSTDCQGLLGKTVRSSTGENMGRIVDVIVDRNGKARAAVIDFGGFLGVGSRKIAIDWSALHFTPDAKDGGITLELTRNQVKSGPEYKDGKPVVVLGASGRAHPMPVDAPASDGE